MAPSRILLAIIRSVSPQSKIFHFEENENAEQDEEEEEEKWLRKCTRYNKSGWRGEIILCTCKYVTTMARAERDDRIEALLIFITHGQGEMWKIILRGGGGGGAASKQRRVALNFIGHSHMREELPRS